MRTLTAFAVAILAVAAMSGVGAAQDDRYGPPPAPSEYAVAPDYNGPYLSWGSKSAPEQVGASGPQADAPTPPPVRLHGRRSFVTAGAQPPQAEAPQPSPPPQPLATYQPAPQADAPPPEPQPQAFEAEPAPPAMASPPALPPVQPAPTAEAAPAPAPMPPTPQPIAQAPQPQAPQPQAMAQNTPPPAAAPNAPVGAHFYSVDRDYGLTPDPVPLPQDHPMVLIGPGEDGAQGAASDNASDNAKGDGDKGGDDDKGDGAPGGSD